MNTADTPQQIDATAPDPAGQVPDEPRARPAPVEAATTREAVRAAPVARDAIVRGRGVEWVRPTDLIARHSAHAAGRGLDFQAELARRTRTPIGASVRRLGDRARRLPPISAFGRSSTSASQPLSQPAASMS